MALAEIEVKGKKYRVEPDGMVDSFNEYVACEECDLAKECDHHAMFCRDYAYRVHFKIVEERVKV